jgi:peptidylprolyl isomerase
MPAKTGDKVKVHYTLKDAKGTVVESSRDSMPIEFEIGKGTVILGFEENITGMSPSEKKTVVIPPDHAYGARDEKKIFEYSRKQAPGEFDPRIGDSVQLHWPDGKKFPVTVIGKSDKSFTMDANHPLAGKELTFDLELLEILSD